MPYVCSTNYQIVRQTCFVLLGACRLLVRASFPRISATLTCVSLTAMIVYDPKERDERRKERLNEWMRDRQLETEGGRQRTGWGREIMAYSSTPDGSLVDYFVCVCVCVIARTWMINRVQTDKYELFKSIFDLWTLPPWIGRYNTCMQSVRAREMISNLKCT